VIIIKQYLRYIVYLVSLSIVGFANTPAYTEIVEDIAGNANGISATGQQLNSIVGISNALNIDYSNALMSGQYVDRNTPTVAELQKVINAFTAAILSPIYTILLSTDKTVFVPGTINIAEKFGTAIQGQDYGSNVASLAIDGNVSTWNHTQCNAIDNWWQLELPNTTKISKLIIHNRIGQEARLVNAKVYLSNTTYSGTVIPANEIELLDRNITQTFKYAIPKEGRYLLIKANAANCLHLPEVEVYGIMPATPIFVTPERNFLISSNTLSGDKVATVPALDYQGDNLTYRIIGSVPFVIDAQGNIFLSGTLTALSYSFDIEISDGINIRRITITIDVTSKNAVSDVLLSGDVLQTNITENELIQATLDEIARLRLGDTLLAEIYGTGSISYVPGNYSSQLIDFYGDKGNIFPILYGTKNNILALAGTKESSRISIFSSNPFYFFTRSQQLAYEPYMKRILLWLMAGKPIDLNVGSLNKTVALSFVSNSLDVESWIRTNYPNWVLKNCNNSLNLSTCYSGADLIIVGNAGTNIDATSLKKELPLLMAQGTSLLYLHPDWGENSLSTTIEETFELSFSYGGNYWANDFASWLTVNDMQQAFFNQSGYAPIEMMFKHFRNNDYMFDWNRCKDSSGIYGQDNDNCSEVVGLDVEFQNGATAVKKLIDNLDKSKKNIFLTQGYRLQKLLTLTADKFRQSVIYPMDKVLTDDNLFMKSYYSDHVIYNYRTINPKQLDMGNFSRSDFSYIVPTERNITLVSKKYFRSTGAYALPGQTVMVTRKDDSNLTVKVFVNSLRSGATHQFEKNGYNRPKYLQTPHFTIDSNETIRFTSPYGGPIQLEFSANDLNVSMTFSNVGEHPYWKNVSDNLSFSQKLAASEYDWAEIATSGFEVHSKLDKMITSVEDIRWGGTAEGLANAVVQYTSNYPHVLAGFKGSGIDIVPEIHDWAVARGMTVETIDIVKHMNADQATCGYGCSGNPYDAYWAFDPIGHGDIHEMGHNMQLKDFEGFPNHAATNTFSYYTKSRYFLNTGGAPNCQGLPFKNLFDTIQSSVGDSNITAYLQNNLWNTAGLGEQYLLKIEAMMHAQKLGMVQNGWHVLARVHILEREMKRAKLDWLAKRASVGFSTYTLTEINSIGNTDWLVIAYSYAAGLDYRNYFDMMGIPYSQKARNQIASFGFPMVPNSLFVSTDMGYCKTDSYGTVFNRPTLPIDGITLYPY
jgi:hypothetical protein